MVKQLSVFLENSEGRLAMMTKTLGDAGIDLLALSIADTTNFGILRAIVSDNDKAVEALRAANYTVNLTDVLAAIVPDRPGGLAEVLDLLFSNDVNVEYLYSFVRKADADALILFKVDNPELAQKIFTDHKVVMLSQEDILKL